MEFEFLLCSRRFARPRQFVLHCDRLPGGRELEAILCDRFGRGPWFVADRRLCSLPPLAPGTAPVITDVPAHPEPCAVQALQLYVLDGPDAGARIELLPGIYPVGRCAPLWLQDAALARVQANVHVDHRDILLQPEPGCPVQVLACAQRIADGSIRLRRGSVLRMGSTVFRVDDPQQELAVGSARWPVPPPQPPSGPQPQRLLAILGAALTPVVIALVLLLATGSRLFLLLCGCSALLALLPLAGAVRQRGRHRRALHAHAAQWNQVRHRVAPPLGTVVAAEASALVPRPPNTHHPVLVLGSGTWNAQPAAGNSGSPGPWGRLRPLPSPIFALESTGAWQLVCRDPTAGYPVLFAMLARLLPTVRHGGPGLLVDPALDLLPASLLLWPNVRLGRALGPVDPGCGQLRAGEEDKAAPTAIHLVSGTAEPVPGALVIGLGPRASHKATGWVNVHDARAQLDDPQAHLEQLERLGAEQFARFLERRLSITRHDPPVTAAVAHARVLQAALGRDAAGAPLGLDLVRDGPHVLLAGTTGSGKSEALRRIVIELAASHPPQDLALALVDFKGGASLGAFAPLPHTQLVITDLDEARAARVLHQLENEIRRRERLLQQAGCSDIGEYQRDPARPALPRLVVVIDEFRVLLEQLPEAGARSDRIATVGRALGIHLLLATQKPTGTLSGQTRANINTVIALRVREPGESSDLVGIPGAAALQLPGEAIMRGATRAATTFRFDLAAPGPPAGYLAERARLGFSEHRCTPLAPRPAAESPLLDDRIARVCRRWRSEALPPNPFAPDLPDSLEVPLSVTPGPGQIVCGLLDDIAGGALRPLPLFDPDAPALLVNGLPEAGVDHLTRQLLEAPTRLLYFDGGAPPSLPSEPHRVLLDGVDVYRFADAVDHLEQAADLRGTLVVARNLSGLAANLPAALFSRLDEVLGARIRTARASGMQLVILGDRDISLLKSTQLCTRRWYLPLGAPQAMIMSWPRMPRVSPLPGRGVALGPDGVARTIQLARFKADAATVSPAWPTGRPADDQAGTWLVGHRGLCREPEHFDPQHIGFVLIADERLRTQVARLLSGRWKLECCTSLPQHEVPGTLGLLLHRPPGPQQAARLNELAAAGRRIVVFTAPSARLAYDFGLPGLLLDERDLLVIEATHPHDMLPVNWPVLAPAGEAMGRDWLRAVKLVNGQPRMVHIARRSS